MRGRPPLRRAEGDGVESGSHETWSPEVGGKPTDLPWELKVENALVCRGKWSYKEPISTSGSAFGSLQIEDEGIASPCLQAPYTIDI